MHTMSVFSQYVPYEFADGTWESRREEVKRLGIASIGRYVSNFPDAVVEVDVLGPPDIEREVGLTGGHIFQGDCLPRVHVGSTAALSHADGGRLPLRRLHASRRQRDRGQRAQRGDGGAPRDGR